MPLVVHPVFTPTKISIIILRCIKSVILREFQSEGEGQDSVPGKESYFSARTCHRSIERGPLSIGIPQESLTQGRYRKRDCWRNCFSETAMGSPIQAIEQGRIPTLQSKVKSEVGQEVSRKHFKCVHQQLGQNPFLAISLAVPKEVVHKPFPQIDDEEEKNPCASPTTSKPDLIVTLTKSHV